MSNFGTGGLLAASVGAILFSSIWLGWMSIAILVIWLATYVTVLKKMNQHFRPDGSLRRHGNGRRGRR